MAVLLVIGPIFEADLLPQQYGFRPGVDAKMAVRRVFWHITQHGRREVVDADLRDYFTSIPHTPLLRSLRRRIADGQLLHVIKNWLTVPVVEYIDGPSPSLPHFQAQTKAAHAFQVVVNLGYQPADCFRVHQPVVVPAWTFLSQLL
jgi:hypothetical protein